MPLNPWDSTFYTEKKAIEHNTEQSNFTVEEALSQIEELLSKNALTANNYLTFLDIIDNTIIDDTVTTIEHYGIKGMRWGVRRTDKELGHDRILSKIEEGQKEVDSGYAAVHMIMAGKRGNKNNKEVLNEYHAKYKDAEKKSKIAEKNFQKALTTLNKGAVKKGVQLQYVDTLTKEELKTLGLQKLVQNRDKTYKEYVKAQQERYGIIMEGAEKIIPTISDHQRKKYSERAVANRQHRNTVIRQLGSAAAIATAASITGIGLAKLVEHSSTTQELGGVFMSDKPIAVVYQECSESEADAEHTYYYHVICGNCSKPIGTTLQEKLREEVTQCPNCKCTLDYQDSEIEHHGVKGMRWGVRKDRTKSSRESGDNDDMSKKELLRQRKADNDMINKKLSRLSSMTPEEADEFIAQLKRMNTATRLNEERLRAISQTQLVEIQLQKAKLEAINAGLSGVKTSMEIATRASRTKVAKKAAKELGKRLNKKGS